MDKNNTKQQENDKNEETEQLEVKQPESKDSKVKELEEQIRELENRWKRAIADYQNQEKWVREQRSEWIKSANRDILLRILPILDTLVLAQQHSQDETLTVAVGHFLDILKAEGVTKIETIGKEFDPMRMEAISTEPGKENKVTKEVRVGYMLYDKVLRPAQVIVGNGE